MSDAREIKSQSWMFWVLTPQTCQVVWTLGYYIFTEQLYLPQKLDGIQQKENAEILFSPVRITYVYMSIDCLTLNLHKTQVPSSFYHHHLPHS